MIVSRIELGEWPTHRATPEGGSRSTPAGAQDLARARLHTRERPHLAALRRRPISDGCRSTAIEAESAPEATRPRIDPAHRVRVRRLGHRPASGHDAGRAGGRVNRSRRRSPNPCVQANHGGGGNRTRVRGRTGMSVYKHRSPFRFALRPVGDLPTAKLALLKCRASDEWLFFGAKPAS